MPRLALFRWVSTCAGLGIIYGVIHDEITAHLCVEYFSIAHPDLFHTTSPTLLGLGWGIVATLPLSLMFCVLLALVVHSPNQPPEPSPRIYAAITGLLSLMAFSAFLSGLAGWLLGQHHLLTLPQSLRDLIPPEKQTVFLAVWFAHIASYLSGSIGMISLIVYFWRKRRSNQILSFLPKTGLGYLRLLILFFVLGLVCWWRF